MTRLLTFLFATLLSFTTVTEVLAQAAWEAPLKAQLERIDAEGSPAVVKQTAPTIERIALGNPDAWIPNYYAARISLLQHYMAGEDGCLPCIDKVDSFLEIAEKADNNSEVMTLRASYYQTMLGLYPMRAPYYAPKAANRLEQAIEADASNPRAHSLLGQNYYYTPAMFGGGPTKAAPYLATAVELFDAEAAQTDRNSFLPTWGADRAKAMHGKAVVEAN
ncbi:MAG: hypothetical protein AB8F78_11370 [Saprospiraceae bacterium]